TLTTPTDITLTWRPPDPAAAGQIVEYTNEPNTPYTILAFLPPTVTTYEHPDLIPQTAFYYRVRPYYGTASNPVEVTLPPGDVDPSTPDDVAKVVVRALTARRPRARYKVGMAPRLLPKLYRLLPARAWDAFWGRQFPVT
ncbi:hypothetical protein ACFQ1S_28725, partial [Kibdelosporangium lantanae]